MVRWVRNTMPPSGNAKTMSYMGVAKIREVRQYHKSFPQYRETPLAALPNLAARLGVGGIYVKDESQRFGLNSFKALGATYALGSFIAKTSGRPVWECGYDYLTSPEAKRSLGEFTFYAATDGNHGRAVAWAAAQIGQKSVIYMPKGCPLARLENIRNEGAEAYITDGNYDETIRLTASIAAGQPQSAIVQDTAWEGYEDMPRWIMQGYAVMALEAADRMSSLGVTPTHMLIQAGVGAFAGSALGLISNYYGHKCPVTFVVEPTGADCHFRSALAGDGTIVKVGGEMKTMMAGLACGEPNPISWEILKNYSSYFAVIDDCHAARGMRTLGAPLRGDPRLISGESGASTMGFLLELLTNEGLSDLREDVGINENSNILLFSTEGDTDPENYLDVVWRGKHES